MALNQTNATFKGHKLRMKRTMSITIIISTFTEYIITKLVSHLRSATLPIKIQ